MTAHGPINYLPIADAFSWQFGSYIATAQVTAYTYEWLLSILDECAMVSNSGITWPISIYFLSRISQIMYLGLVLSFNSAPSESCEVATTMIGVCAGVTGAATNWLFLLRVRAVYLQSIQITILFGTLWLVTQALMTLASTAIHAVHIVHTPYCLDISVNYLPLPGAAIFAYDTLVFLAISYRLAEDASTTASGWRSRILSVTKGQGLYTLSKSLMRSGQQYYL
ncbi:hypothetical protein FIBSPDRAFT_938116 [Athelia psychrophila]|uniref:Uncharacterized protein n=1 Tax=Athelia psychrophila TaxID=1759441 RepID=A0A165Z5M4_9AGAM|nr:hypothetical protein FIBSPDRAFT_938116 [Fibularhizoctonia sp. CBS 109695]